MELKYKYLTPEIVNQFSEIEIKITEKYKGGYYISYDHKQILLILKNENIEEIKKKLKKHTKIVYEKIKKPKNKRCNTFYFILANFSNWQKLYLMKDFFKKHNLRQRFLRTSKEVIKNILKDENQSRN